MARDDETAGMNVDLTGWLMLGAFGLLLTAIVGLIGVVTLGATHGWITLAEPPPETTPTKIAVNWAVVLVLLATGLAILWFSARGILVAQRSKRRARAFPRQPWKWEAGFDGGILRADPRAEARWLWLGAFGLSLVVVPFAVLVLPDPRALILLPFALVAAWLYWRAIARTRDSRRSGAVQLRLARLPLVPGETFEGLLELPRGLEGDAKVTLQGTLHKTTGGQTKSRTHYQETFHEASELVSLLRAPDGTVRARVAFEVPKKAASAPRGRDAYVTWFLRVTDAEKRLDESFELPVFVAKRPEDVERFPLDT